MASQRLTVTLGQIEEARQVIAKVALRTRLRAAPSDLQSENTHLHFKMENEQLTGSFKIRGAFNKMSALSESERRAGVIASSAGNHAQGVAFAAQKLGVRAHIVMPLTTPIVKINSVRALGAEVILHGEYYDEAYAHAMELVQKKGYVFVSPYQDSLIIAGQGTIGLEILEDLPSLETLVVPIGGGGLISGVATAIKAKKPSVRIIGVVSDQAAGMMDLKRGQRPSPRKISTIAEGIAIKNPSQIMYESFISPLVDEIVAVSDDEIAQAMVLLMEKGKTVTEGSGAAGYAAVLTRGLKLGSETCVVLCGGNVDLNVMAKVIERGLRRQNRLARIGVVVDDLPGNLNRLTTVMAEKRANVLEVLHDRVSPELGLRETRIDLLVETSSREHLIEIQEAIRSLGFTLLR